MKTNQPRTQGFCVEALGTRLDTNLLNILSYRAFHGWKILLKLRANTVMLFNSITSLLIHKILNLDKLLYILSFIYAQYRNIEIDSFFPSCMLYFSSNDFNFLEI